MNDKEVKLKNIKLDNAKYHVNKMKLQIKF